MPRCQNCNKFCLTEVGEPSVDDIEIDCAIAFGPQSTAETVASAWKPGDPSFLSIKAEISIEKTSECCGDDVASAAIQLEEEIDDEDVLAKVIEHLAKVPPEGEDHEIEIEEAGTAYVEEGEGRKRAERVDVEWVITCCGETLGEGIVSDTIEEWDEVS